MRKLLKGSLRNNHGSTLIMLIITIMVLSLLGTVILSLTVLNMRLKIQDRQAKKAFYLAEAGLEESYAVIQEQIEKAIAEGNQQLDTKLQQFLELERQEMDSEYLDEDGNIIYEKIEELQKHWFQETYKNYMNEHLIQALKDTTLGVLPEDGTTSKAVLSIDEANDFQKYSATNNIFKFYIDSLCAINSEVGNTAVKEIRTQFVIGVPNSFSQPYFISNEAAKLRENILWKKALSTEKNIYVKGSNVSVTGDIYAYGEAYGEDRGGIAVGWDSVQGKLKVTEGTVVTSKHFMVNENNSEIDVAGHVFCNTIGIKETVNGGKINVYGNVNTEDDIELNGTNSSISIDGSYYGFSDGTGQTIQHDNSSSIVINSYDIGEGSTISITGEQRDYQELTEQGVAQPTDGVLVFGTVYIGVDTPYQTGESVSIKGNYVAYGRELSGLSGDYEKYNKENIIFEDFPPLVLANRFLVPSTELNSIDKRNYIYSYNQLNKDNPLESLNLGGNGISLQNVRYSLGTYVVNGVMHNGINQSDYELDRLKVINLYKKNVNKLNDKLAIDESQFDHRVYIHDNPTVGREGRFRFTADFESMDKGLVHCYTGNKNIVLVGPGGSEPSSLNSSNSIIYRLSSPNVKGLILTKGKVYVYGQVNYRGTIAALDSIYIEDNHPKTFTNDKVYIMQRVYAEQSLRDQFVHNGDVVDFDYSSEAGSSSAIPTYYKTEDLININSWVLNE